MKDILQFYTGSILLLAAWLILRSKMSARLWLTVLWLAVLVLGALVGAMTWQTNYECTRIASAILGASGSLLTGPFLMLSAKRNWNPTWSAVAAVVLPFASAHISAITLLYCGQIWI